MEALEERMRRLVLAYERLEAAWRREHSLTANEELVTAFLAADGPLTPTDLSDMVGLTTAGISTLVDRLEAEGYVHRRRRGDDRRRVLVTLTKKGMRARMQFEAVNHELSRRLGHAYTDQVDTFLAEAEKLVLEHAGRPSPPASD